ncbi:MAG TPA: hypothetical protein VLB82_13440 [Thermodesulfobacteriota bacterium]|jgi:formate-dependent phosphoribosylglycinamide formyltransferase (GAR transformylase)|nr:hypothetical protein [Thermodesulfobacteriota bacterium]
MPCTKCENGKYKWGKTGECKYDSKEECEKANPKKYSKMKPTPLGKKSYEEYEKELKEFNLSKVERVELGLVDDIEKIYGEVINNASKADKAKNNAIESVRKFKLETVKIKQDSAEGLKKLEEFKKAAKELGVDVPSRIQSFEKSFETSLKSMENFQSAADKAMKLL